MAYKYFCCLQTFFFLSECVEDQITAGPVNLLQHHQSDACIVLLLHSSNSRTTLTAESDFSEFYNY